MGPREWIVAIKSLAQSLDNFREDCEAS